MAENRARIAQDLDLAAAQLTGVYQTHSRLCHVVDTPWPMADRPEGDALVTSRKGIALSVLSADCAPVLFAGPGVIGAAHAGWAGALKGILESTLDKMEEQGAKASQITAVVGPCIGPDSYEVSAGFDTEFLQEDAAAAQFFRISDKLRFDLPGYCAFRLKRAGVGTVEISCVDTFARNDRYFSHRHGDKGRQLSVIALG